MKIRIASVLLAFLLLVSLWTVAFADDLAEVTAPVETEVTETVEEEQAAAVFYLDGEPMNDVVAQCIGGTYYVTLASMMAEVDEAAVVEQSAEVATLTAELVRVTEVAEEEEETPAMTVQYVMTDAGLIPVMVPVSNPAPGFDGSAPAEEAVTEVVDTLSLTAAVGEQYLVANGRYLYAADGIISIDGMVAVPVRTLAEALNLSVAYNGETGCVELTSSGELGYLEDADTYYDEESLYWLSRIIYSESGNQSLEGKIAVGNVVLNRVEHGNFPDTIYDVIFQKNQFSPAGSGSIHRDPNAESIVAAKLVLDGAEVMEDALFFNRVGLKCYASKNRTFVATIGGHSFYA